MGRRQGTWARDCRERLSRVLQQLAGNAHAGVFITYAIDKTCTSVNGRKRLIGPGDVSQAGSVLCSTCEPSKRRKLFCSHSESNLRPDGDIAHAIGQMGPLRPQEFVSKRSNQRRQFSRVVCLADSQPQRASAAEVRLQEGGFLFLFVRPRLSRGSRAPGCSSSSSLNGGDICDRWLTAVHAHLNPCRASEDSPIVI